MSKIVSGQRRVEDTSSATLGQFREQGNGRGKLKGIVPKPTMNKRLNPKKESSHRGKGGLVVIDPKGTPLHNQSSFIESKSFHSIGGMRLTNANIEGVSNKAKKIPDRKKGKKAVKKPKRGNDSKPGKGTPNKKGNKVPTKSSDVIKGNLKKINKRPKKLTKKQVGKPKKVLKAPREQRANNKESYQ